jgi:glycosyltransferase A (GT-A) superfamily protein (DUF2064 family)
MTGVYGDLLSYFPELFREVSFWDRDPALGAGYDKGEEKRYKVIVITDNKGSFQDKKAAEYKALDFFNKDVLYTGADTPIVKGMFLRHPDDGDIFIVDVALDYSFTGGFRMWGISRVQGANGENTGSIGIKEGIY